MKKKIILLLVVLVTLSGCTKKLVDKDGKAVINETTGQGLTSNILCLPESKDLLSIYQQNEKNLDIKLKDLSSCKNMKIYEKKSYNGLWVALFVRPLAWIIIKLGVLLGNYGLSMCLVGLLIRIILMPLSAKTARQQEMLKEAQPAIDKIEKKYAGKTDQNSLMMKSQETLAVYKKYNINPMSSCLGAFIQLPLFFAFLEAINRVPAIFENTFLTFQLGTTPLVGIKQGNYLYILLIILIVLFTILSFKNSMAGMSGNSEQAKQTKFMLIFMTIFLGIASVQLPAAIALYWVVTNAFNVAQQYVIKKRGSKHES